MKQFSSLHDAINYQISCPVCDYEMQITNSRQNVKDHYNQIDHKFVWYLGKGEAITADTDTNKCELVLNNNVSGCMFLAIWIECEECYQYSYTIRIKIDLTERSVSDINLNSEFITVLDDEHFTHEIRNVYATKQTEYWYTTNGRTRHKSYPKIEKTIILPLVPLNLEQPEKTLERIKSLIVFS
jgi:hypothetical protein